MVVSHLLKVAVENDVVAIINLHLEQGVGVDERVVAVGALHRQRVARIKRLHIVPLVTDKSNQGVICIPHPFRRLQPLLPSN